MTQRHIEGDSDAKRKLVIWSEAQSSFGHRPAACAMLCVALHRLIRGHTLTVDFPDETTSFALMDPTKAFIEFVLAYILSIGFQLNHTSTCTGGCGLIRHSHDVRILLGGLPIWRI
jgi:hypothetical protein